MYLCVFSLSLSALCADRHINERAEGRARERKREKARNVEKKNTIRLLAGWRPDVEEKEEKKRRLIIHAFLSLSLSPSLVFFETTLTYERAGQARA